MHEFARASMGLAQRAYLQRWLQAQRCGLRAGCASKGEPKQLAALPTFSTLQIAGGPRTCIPFPESGENLCSDP